MADGGIQSPPGDDLTEQRRSLPDQPGVYMFRDEEGRVLYVGKARSIRKRVGGHFSGKTRTPAMIDQVNSIEFLVTGTGALAVLNPKPFMAWRPGS